MRRCSWYLARIRVALLAVSSVEPLDVPDLGPDEEGDVARGVFLWTSTWSFSRALKANAVALITEDPIKVKALAVSVRAICGNDLRRIR